MPQLLTCRVAKGLFRSTIASLLPRAAWVRGTHRAWRGQPAPWRPNASAGKHDRHTACARERERERRAGETDEEWVGRCGMNLRLGRTATKFLKYFASLSSSSLSSSSSCAFTGPDTRDEHRGVCAGILLIWTFLKVASSVCGWLKLHQEAASTNTLAVATLTAITVATSPVRSGVCKRRLVTLMRKWVDS